MYLDLTFQVIVFRVFTVAIIAMVAGLVPAVLARLLGDPGPAYDGRQTLDPTVSLDLLGTIAFLVFGLGWIKPIDLAPSELRPKIAGTIAIVLGATVAVMALAVIASLLFGVAALYLGDTAAQIAYAYLREFIADALGFALVNLIPAPPLAGGYLLDALWPEGSAFLRKHAGWVGVVLLAFLATTMPGTIMGYIVAPMLRVLTHASAGAI